MQWGNLLCERTRRLSIFQHPPIGNRLTSNYYLFPAMAIALIIAVFFSYIPGIQKAFLTRGVTVEHYFLPIAFGVGMLVLEELRKLAVRTYPNGLLAKIAW